VSQGHELSEKVKRQINQMPIHDSWEGTYRLDQNERSFECCFDDFVKVLNQPQGSHALDIGCGICANAVRLAQRGYRVTGADYSEVILEPARRYVERAGLSDRITVQREDIMGLSFPNNHFDLALCFGVLMHVPEAGGALDELVRVVKPGGYVVFEEINRSSPEAYFMRWVWRTFKRSKIQAITTPAGIEHTSMFAGEQLFWRHADLRWMVEQMRARSCSLVSRRPSVSSDMHIYARPEFARRAIHALNRFWIRRVGLAGPSYHNIFIFKKELSAQST
jgi:2-polyprenyl-3-methyl-5-hydroxy-6-metoxy-1,4-benzoquinol methylase